MREGSCLGCGQLCCTRIGVPVTNSMMEQARHHFPMSTPDFKDADYNRWLALHGYEPNFELPPDAHIVALGGRLVALWRKSCQELQADGRCGIYNDRPQVCQDWPAAPWELAALEEAEALCGYSFKEE